MDKTKLKNMRVRALSGAVYVGLLVAALLMKPFWFTILMAIFAILAVLELENLLSNNTYVPAQVKFCDAVAAGCLVGISVDINFLYLVLLYLPVRIILAVSDRSDNPARGMLYSMLAMLYAAAPLAVLAYANYYSKVTGNFLGMHTNIVLITFVMIWINDTGAYLTGMSFGRHKMCERLSPKKTWEGFWGGFALTVICGICVSLWFSRLGNICSWMIYGAAVSVVGTYGDLFESLIKRTLGVKDSGHIIPGHGGILDRMDSILAVAPLTLLFVVWQIWG